MSMRRCLIDVETRVTNDIESDTSRQTRYSMIRSPELPKGPSIACCQPEGNTKKFEKTTSCIP
jgi:hypothetical protein